MGNKNRRNRGKNQGNKQQTQTPVERINFLYNGSRQKELIDVLIDDSIVRNNPKIIVELSSEFVSPVLGMGIMEDLIDTEAEMLCSRMVLQAIKDFRSFHNDVDNMERIFNRIANDAVNNAEFESLGDDLFTTIQAKFPDVTDADAMRLAIYVFVNNTLKSILGISDDIQTDEDENIEVSASTSTAEPENSDEKISTEETPLIENKEDESEKNVIDVEYREVETSKSDSDNSSDTKTDFEIAVMARLEELSELAVKESLPIVKDFCEKSEATVTDNTLYDTIKSVSISQLSMSWSPDELLKGKPENLLSKIETEMFAQVCGKIIEISLRTQLQKAKEEQSKTSEPVKEVDTTKTVETETLEKVPDTTSVVEVSKSSEVQTPIQTDKPEMIATGKSTSNSGNSTDKTETTENVPKLVKMIQGMKLKEYTTKSGKVAYIPVF